MCTLCFIPPFLYSLFVETFHKENSDYIWQDRTTCALSTKAAEKISYITVSTKESENSISGGKQSILLVCPRIVKVNFLNCWRLRKKNC